MSLGNLNDLYILLEQYEKELIDGHHKKAANKQTMHFHLEELQNPVISKFVRALASEGYTIVPNMCINRDCTGDVQAMMEQFFENMRQNGYFITRSETTQTAGLKHRGYESHHDSDNGRECKCNKTDNVMINVSVHGIPVQMSVKNDPASIKRAIDVLRGMM